MGVDQTVLWNYCVGRNDGNGECTWKVESHLRGPSGTYSKVPNLTKKGLPNQQYGAVIQISWASPKTITPENNKVKDDVFTQNEKIILAHTKKSSECVGAMVTTKARGKWRANYCYPKGPSKTNSITQDTLCVLYGSPHTMVFTENISPETNKVTLKKYIFSTLAENSAG